MDYDAVFEAILPDPLRGVVNHAERLAAALALAETDESRDMQTGPRELGLAETWVVGRSGEVAAFVSDVVRDWSIGVLPLQTAALSIEQYVILLHRDMALVTSLGAPTCCAHPAVTVDIFASRSHRSYPRILSGAPAQATASI